MSGFTKVHWEEREAFWKVLGITAVVTLLACSETLSVCPVIKAKLSHI